MKMHNILVLVFLWIIVNGCSNEPIVHAYVVTKQLDEQDREGDWQPLMRVTFRVGENKVISEVASLVDEYGNCTIVDKHNWECRYTDGRGMNKFGFKGGDYWKNPGWGENIKYVSRWEYNVIRCKWYQKDEGKIDGLASCFRTFI